MPKWLFSCLKVGALLLAGVIASSCATSQPPPESSPSPFTHGNVQLNLKKGVTTQNEVLETFGPPNVATTDGSGMEVWTYQKQATVAKSESENSYGTVILFGGSAASSGFSRSSKTMTLIIKFNGDKTVSDFRSMATSF